MLQVDPGSVVLGPDEALTVRYRIRDLNHDKVPDLLVYFLAEDSGISCGAIEAEVSGSLYDGTRFAGADMIQLQGC
jgi:hypothetical protein